MTPIATPNLAQGSYLLKDWTESEALDLIRLLEVYAHDNDLPAPAHGRYNFPSAYTLVELAIREMKFNFPDSEYEELLDWRLAMAAKIQGKDEYDDWLLMKIEAYLNQKSSNLEELNEYLLPRGFTVGEEYHVENLFGNGSDGIVYRVEARDSFGEMGLVFAVREMGNSSYKVEPITSDWTIVASIDRIVDTLDHTRNGIPEVVFETLQSSGSMCSSRLKIFEWNGGHFVDLTGGQIDSLECLDWEFRETEVNSAEAIFNSDWDVLPVENTFSWNGSAYELSDRQVMLHGLTVYCSKYTYILDSWDDYRHGIGALQSVMDAWTDEHTEILGPSCPDFLRFQIAVTYAIQGDESDAREILRALTVSPSEPLTPTVSLAADVFLQNYNSQDDLFQSCLAAQNKVNDLVAEYMDAHSDATEEIVLGYTFFFEREDICDWEALFPLLIQSLDRSSLADPLLKMKAAGYQAELAKNLDLDGDRDLDWLVAVKYPSDRSLDLWALLNTGQGLYPVHFSFADSGDFLERSLYTLEIIPGNGSNDRWVVLQYGRHFDLYRFGHDETSGDFHNIFSEWGDMEEYKIDRTGQVPEIEIVYSKAADLRAYYRWNEQSQEFEPLPLYENDIFSGDGPAAALPYLESLARCVDKDQENVQDCNKPRLLYLWGLANELTGNQARAANLYWRVWHDHPDSGFARMACAKLEGCIQ